MIGFVDKYPKLNLRPKGIDWQMVFEIFYKSRMKTRHFGLCHRSCRSQKSYISGAQINNKEFPHGYLVR